MMMKGAFDPVRNVRQHDVNIINAGIIKGLNCERSKTPAAAAPVFSFGISGIILLKSFMIRFYGLNF